MTAANYGHPWTGLLAVQDQGEGGGLGKGGVLASEPGRLPGSSRECVRVEGQGFGAEDRGSISVMVPDEGHLEKRGKAK